MEAQRVSSETSFVTPPSDIRTAVPLPASSPAVRLRLTVHRIWFDSCRAYTFNHAFPVGILRFSRSSRHAGSSDIGSNRAVQLRSDSV
jgi:hypothetical protein